MTGRADSLRERIEEGRCANIAARRNTPKSKPLTPGQLAWRKRKAKSDRDAAKFKIMCREAGLPMPVREFKFAAPERNWAADFAWPEERVLLEVEGAVWSGGRHTRGSGYLADMLKYNSATLRGYKLLRCTPQQLCTSATLSLVRAALTPEGA